MRDFTYEEMYQSETKYFWFLGKQAFVSAIIKNLALPQSPQILDIGCGTGGTTLTLSKWGSVTGIERNTRAASFARKRKLKIIVADIHHIPFSKNSFDLVTILDVLYHKGINERVVLREAYRIVKPGGYIIILDSAIPWLWSKHDEIMDAKYRYSKKTLSSAITRAGYSVHRIQYIYATIFPIFVVVRYISKIFPSPRTFPSIPLIVNKTLTLLLSLEASWYPKFNPPVGSSLSAVIKKV